MSWGDRSEIELDEKDKIHLNHYQTVFRSPHDVLINRRYTYQPASSKDDYTSGTYNK